MGTLNEEEKGELKSLAWSAEIREEFRRLRTLYRGGSEARINVDHFLSFLTAMARLRPELAKPRSFLPYTDVRI